MNTNEIKYLENTIRDYKEAKERKIQVWEWLEKIEKVENCLSKFMNIDFEEPLSKQDIANMQNLQFALHYAGVKKIKVRWYSLQVKKSYLSETANKI